MMQTFTMTKTDHTELLPISSGGKAWDSISIGYAEYI